MSAPYMSRLWPTSAGTGFAAHYGCWLCHGRRLRALVKGRNALRAVLCGSFRKAPDLLREDFKALIAIATILSPGNVEIQSERDGFAYMAGESSSLPAALEWRHLSAIAAADFVWLHMPNRYLGPSAMAEIGFAAAVGVPVFAAQLPMDERVRSIVLESPSPDSVVSRAPATRVALPAGCRASRIHSLHFANAFGYVALRLAAGCLGARTEVEAVLDTFLDALHLNAHEECPKALSE